MYYNTLGEMVSRARWKEMLNAQKNRREIIAARLSRREMFKLGLLTSAGYLVAKSGLSTWASDGCGPGYHVSTMSNGDKIYVRFQGNDTRKDGKPETSEGTWSYIGGTGKLKGIKGKGTYKGKADADGNMVTEVEGDYKLPAAKK